MTDKLFMKYLIFVFFPLLSFAQNYQDATLVNGPAIERMMSGNNLLFSYYPKPLNQELIKKLSDPAKRSELFENDLYKIKNISSEAMCCKNKECFNPQMEKKEWQDIIGKALSEFESTYSESSSNQVVLKKALYDEIEVLKQDPKCVSGKNDCRGRLRIVLSTYSSFFTPNFPEVQRPVKYDPEDIKFQFSDYSLAERYKEKFDTYKKMAELVATDATIHNSSDPWKSAYKKIMQSISSRYDDKWISIFYPSLAKDLAVYQSILSQRASRFDNRISNIVEPRKGYIDPSHPVCNTNDFLIDPRTYSVNLAAALPIPIPPEMTPKPPCVEKIDFIWKKNVDVTFGTGNEYLDGASQAKLKESAITLFEEKKREGYTVTGYKIQVSSSQPWGSLPPAEAKVKNLNLANKRADNSQKIIDRIPGFSNLDHITDSKLELKNTLLELENKPKAVVQVSGPATVPQSLKSGQQLNDQNLPQVYEAIKDDLQEVKGIKSLEEYKAYTSDPINNIRSVGEATFKPFQFFTIIIEGKKTEDRPCEAESVSGESSNKKSGASEQ